MLARSLRAPLCRVAGIYSPVFLAPCSLVPSVGAIMRPAAVRFTRGFLQLSRPAFGEEVVEAQSSSEIKDPALIFESVWKTLVDKHGEEQLRFPKDILWLSGAPGAGKGAMTKFIMEERGLNAPPIETR
jgi:hypothetical protein